MLIGNKSDLDPRRQVSTEEGERFAKENGLIFMETSAKTAFNVEEAFLQTSSIIYNNIGKGLYDLSSDKCGIRVGNESTTVTGTAGNAGKLTATNNKNQSGGGGCCWRQTQNKTCNERSIVY